MITGVQTGSGIRHDKYNIRGIARVRRNRKNDIFMQRGLYIDEAHTALDIFRFAVFLGARAPLWPAHVSGCLGVCLCGSHKKFQNCMVLLLLQEIVRDSSRLSRKQCSQLGPVSKFSVSLVILTSRCFLYKHFVALPRGYGSAATSSNWDWSSRAMVFYS